MPSINVGGNEIFGNNPDINMSIPQDLLLADDMHSEGIVAHHNHADKL